MPPTGLTDSSQIAAYLKTAMYDAMRDFGARGDGTTDDTAAIQNALNALSAAGGIVYLPPGKYAINSTGLSIPDSDIVLCGAGSDSILFANVTGAATTNVITINGKNRVTIRDLAIDGNRANRTTSGIETQQNGIYLTGASKCAVRNVYAHDNPATGICLDLTTYSAFEGNQCYSNGRNGIYLNFSNSNYNVIRGNICQGQVSYHGIALSNAQNNLVQGNDCYNNGGAGIDLDGTSNYNSIVGNVLVGNTQQGLFLDTVSGYSATYCSIVGNVIEGNLQEGMRLIDAQFNTIVGNAISNNSQQTNNFYDGIRIETGTTGASNNLIANNKVSVNHKNGIELVSVDSQNNIIEGNDVRGNTTAGIALVASFVAVVRFNNGFVTEKHGNASIASGSTSVVVTHGLGITPTLEQISVTAQTAFGSAAKFWVSAPTSTQFTINVDANPGQTVTFGWKADVGY